MMMMMSANLFWALAAIVVATLGYPYARFVEEWLRYRAAIFLAWRIFDARRWAIWTLMRARWHLRVLVAVHRMNAAATEAEALAIRDKANAENHRMEAEAEVKIERYFVENRRRVRRALNREGSV
jgi:hypothetical protein